MKPIRVLSFFLLFFFLLPVLAACERSDLVPDDDLPRVSADTPYFSVTRLSFKGPDDIVEPRQMSMHKTDAGVFFIVVGEKINALHMEEKEYHLIHLQMDGTVKRRTNLSELFSLKRRSSVDLKTTVSGRLYLVIRSIDAEVQDSYCAIGDDGVPGAVISLKKSPQRSDELYKGYREIIWGEDMHFYARGSTVVGYTDHGLVDVYSPDGQYLFGVRDRTEELLHPYSFADKSFIQKNNSVYIHAEYPDGSQCYFPLDTANQCLGESVESLPEDEEKKEKEYWADKDKIYCTDPLTQESTDVVYWKDIDIEGNLLSFVLAGIFPQRVKALSDDLFYLEMKTGWLDSYGYDPAFYAVSRKDTNPNAGKIILRAATIRCSDTSHVYKAVSDFNRSNSDYYIELTHWDRYNNVPDDRITMEEIDELMMSEDRPDIILGGSYSQTIFEPYSEKGIFVDLMPYWEETPNAEEAYFHHAWGDMTESGELFYTFPRFFLEGTTAIRDEVDGKTGMTYEEFMEFAREQGPSAWIMDDYPLYGDSMEGPGFSSLLYRSFSEFYDEETGAMLLDTEKFREVLRFSKEVSLLDWEYMDVSRKLTQANSITSEPSMIPIIFSRWWSTSAYSWQSRWNTREGNITFFDIQPQGHCSPLITPLYYVGITRDTMHADIAWEFVLTLMNVDVEPERGIPVKKSVLRSFLESYPDKRLHRFPGAEPISEEGIQVFFDGVEHGSLTPPENEHWFRFLDDIFREYVEGKISVEQASKKMQQATTEKLANDESE